MSGMCSLAHIACRWSVLCCCVAAVPCVAESSVSWQWRIHTPAEWPTQCFSCSLQLLCVSVRQSAVWREVLPVSSSPVPAARLGMASTWSASNGVWFVYGGWAGPSNASAAANASAPASSFLSDLWRYSFDNRTWQLVTQPADATEAPPPRHTTAAHIHTLRREGQRLAGSAAAHCRLGRAVTACPSLGCAQCWTSRQPCPTSCCSCTSQTSRAHSLALPKEHRVTSGHTRPPQPSSEIKQRLAHCRPPTPRPLPPAPALQRHVASARLGPSHRRVSACCMRSSLYPVRRSGYYDNEYYSLIWRFNTCQRTHTPLRTAK